MFKGLFKKFLTVALLAVMTMFAVSTTASAQTAISKAKFTDNVYIGVSGTVATALKFDPFLPVEGDVSVRLGKWITPALGFNIEETMGFGTPSLWMYYLTKNVVRTNNLGINADVDMFQAVRFKPERKFTMIAEAGLGWLHGYGDGGVDDMSAKTGLMFGFNLGKQKAWQFYLEPEIMWNLTNSGSKPHFHKENGEIGIEAGFTYRFKNRQKSGGTHNFVLYDIDEYKTEIALLVDDNQKLKDIIDSLPKEVHDTVYVEVTNTVNKCDNINVVFFGQGSSEIVDGGVLNAIPEGTFVKVLGYASPEGSASFNEKLSQKRADAVAEYLIQNGVNVVVSEGLGVNGKTSNRVVVVIVQDDAETVIEE